MAAERTMKLSELIKVLQEWQQGFENDPEVLVHGVERMERVTGVERDETFKRGPVLFLLANSEDTD
ncbi:MULTISPECIES: hypothetical protein [unclassified Caballeronia]|uniref:hypothetical protein n=1 Tax=unclassified Caballeronia TaxID=2646786 RepID=UPI0020278184|nr:MULTISPECIES: hypothetical protein [unclassified Caballeronia]